MKPLIIGGPTAVGKSEVACALAEELPAEVISADSMAVYKFMDVGTAKPLECTKKVPHHLIDFLPPSEAFDAKRFEEEALKLMEEISSRGKVPLVVGGTYLYLQALLYGIEETPPPDWELRRKLYRLAEEKGREYLYGLLKEVDPVYAEKIHPNDLRRVVRALEVYEKTGKPFSSFHKWERPKLDFVGVFLTREREELMRRIEERLWDMVRRGLPEEVKKLLDMGYEDFLVSRQAIGYKELIPCVKGEKPLRECVEEAIRHTKAQAKRQIRWFKRQGWHRINLSELSVEEAVKRIKEIFQSELAHSPEEGREGKLSKNLDEEVSHGGREEGTSRKPRGEDAEQGRD